MVLGLLLRLWGRLARLVWDCRREYITGWTSRERRQMLIALGRRRTE